MMLYFIAVFIIDSGNKLLLSAPIQMQGLAELMFYYSLFFYHNKKVNTYSVALLSALHNCSLMFLLSQHFSELQTLLHLRRRNTKDKYEFPVTSSGQYASLLQMIALLKLSMKPVWQHREKLHEEIRAALTNRSKEQKAVSQRSNPWGWRGKRKYIQFQGAVKHARN